MREATKLLLRFKRTLRPLSCGVSPKLTPHRIRGCRRVTRVRIPLSRQVPWGALEDTRITHHNETCDFDVSFTAILRLSLGGTDRHARINTLMTC